MSVLMLQSVPFVAIIAAKLHASYEYLLRDIDAFVEARIRSAVPQRRYQSQDGRVER